MQASNTNISNLEKGLNYTGTISAFIAQWTVLFMTLVVVMGVVTRYALGIALLFPLEYSGFSLVVISGVGAAYALREGSHIRVDFVVKLLPARIGNWLVFVTDLLSIPVVIMLLYIIGSMTYRSWVQGTLNISGMATPLGPVHTLLFFGFLLFLLQFLQVLSKSFRAALHPEKKTGNSAIV